ncbi:MAG: OmpH family outer membrane protein, partial [Pyrinomonadaceae bacterium]
TTFKLQPKSVSGCGFCRIMKTVRSGKKAMNFRRLTAAAMFVASISILQPTAQQAGAPRPAAGRWRRTTTKARPPAPTTAAGATGTITGDTKIAVINTQAFTAEKVGITRLVNAIGGVEREFAPRKAGLQTLQTQMGNINQEIQKTASLAAPSQLSQKQEQMDTMKREFERKQQDAQLAYEKRMSEMLAPLCEDMRQALRSGLARARRSLSAQ